VTDAEPVAAGQDWEQQARNWIAWARKPGFDSYHRYRDDFFALVPPPGRATLDVGCGEGRVTRDLAARGHHVTGIDAAPTLLAAACAADPNGTYMHADAARLPFADGSFDIVVGYNTFMDVRDLPGALAEACRVLAPGGRLCVAVVHPCMNPLVREAVPDRSYFETTRFHDWARRDGMAMLFQGWVHPLTAYTRPLEDAGLVLERIREPRMTRTDGTVTDVPYHLWFRAMRPRQSSSGESG
jgi:SAM-dependent methyltransferase